MGDTLAIEYRIAQAERRWPGLEFRRKTAKEASAPCPFCRLADHDGFVVFSDGGFWCRRCGSKGWLDDDKQEISQEKLLELRIRELERKQKEHEARLSKLEQMARCTDHLRYHQALDDQALEYWWGEGITDASIEHYLLGYCPHCPADAEKRPSYTIPVINAGRLENIRHRLAGATDGNKYRPHMTGLGASLFNADVLGQVHNEVLLVEGEKKAIVLSQAGFPTVGISGQRAFKREWVEKFSNVGTIYVGLDPGTAEAAATIGALFGERARVVAFTEKPDDMIVKRGAGERDIRGFLACARPVR